MLMPAGPPRASLFDAEQSPEKNLARLAVQEGVGLMVHKEFLDK